LGRLFFFLFRPSYIYPVFEEPFRRGARQEKKALPRKIGFGKFEGGSVMANGLRSRRLPLYVQLCWNVWKQTAARWDLWDLSRSIGLARFPLS
jgi:hypothetical protein